MHLQNDQSVPAGSIQRNWCQRGGHQSLQVHLAIGCVIEVALTRHSERWGSANMLAHTSCSCFYRAHALCNVLVCTIIFQPGQVAQ
jgi:hypothetical protein